MARPANDIFLAEKIFHTASCLKLFVRSYREEMLYAIPKPLLKAAGRLQLLRFYLTKNNLLLPPSAIDRYYTNTAFNCQKAIEELNYKITPFIKGISYTIHHLKQKNHEPQ